MKIIILLSLLAKVFSISPEAVPFTRYHSEQKKIDGTTSQINFLFENMNNQDSFEWELTREIFKEKANENVILSPYSVRFLLTILAEAANDVKNETTTMKQLKIALPGRQTLEDARKYYFEAFKLLEKKNDSYVVNFGSKVYTRDSIEPIKQLPEILMANYGLKIEKMNFTDNKKAANIINTWVKKLTAGHISDLVEPKTLTNSAFLLLNAIYFRGLWKVRFEESESRSFAVDSTNVTKEFVTVVDDFDYFYSKELGARLLRLPYKGDKYAMIIILPFEDDGLANLFEKLSSKLLHTEIDQMESTTVNVLLPKFRYDSTLNLNDFIEKLGIKEIFTDNAEFPLLSSRGVKVSKIIQKAGIILDEKGSEAYAATEIELVDKFGGSIRDFIADHPFMFYIEDIQIKAKLFCGIVNNPEY